MIKQNIFLKHKNYNYKELNELNGRRDRETVFCNEIFKQKPMKKSIWKNLSKKNIFFSFSNENYIFDDKFNCD